MAYHGAEVPARFGDPWEEYRAVRNGAGLFDFSFRARFLVRGEHRVPFLHRIVSNDIKNLGVGRGTYATLLNPQGHILVDMRIYNAGDCLIVDTDADLADKAMRGLQKYIVGDRVHLESVNDYALAIQGARARQITQGVLNGDVSSLTNEGDHRAIEREGAVIRLARRSSTGEPGYELWATPDAVETLWKTFEAAGAVPCGVEALEWLRIEAGLPRYGADLGEDTLPLEANLLEALSFNKGCYIGQEIVERARSRGHVNWRLMGLVAEDGGPFLPGEKIEREGKTIAEVTSCCLSPALGKPIALAYVRREVAESGTKLIRGGGGVAEVVSLPFYRPLADAADRRSANTNPSRSTISPASTGIGAENIGPA